MGDDDDPRGFFQSVLGVFTRIRPQKSAKPQSLKTRRQEAWLRADAFAQRDGLDGADPESVERTLRACERYVQDDYDQEIDSVSIFLIQETPCSRSLGPSVPIH